jgi:hypothetical protein
MVTTTDFRNKLVGGTILFMKQQACKKSTKLFSYSEHGAVV